MSDAATISLERFRNPSEWAAVREDVPVFMEHKMYSVGSGASQRLEAVYDGQEPPVGGRLLYEIGKEQLEEIAKAVQANYDQHGTPMKLLYGHTKPGAAQAQQPALIGWGVGAKLGRFGPQNRWAVLTKEYVERGEVPVTVENSQGEVQVVRMSCLDLAKQSPQRSGEFHPATGELSAVAVLKTNPRLPMGVVACYEHTGRSPAGTIHYADNKLTVCYGGLGMADINDDKDEGAKDLPPGETDITGEPDADDGLTPEEQASADKIINYMMTKFPALSKVCMGDGAPPDAAAMGGMPPVGGPPMPPGGPAPGGPPMGGPPGPGMIPMSKDAVARIAALEREAAESHVDLLLGRLAAQGVRYSADEERPRMLAMPKAARDQWYKHMLVRYQRDAVPPVGGSWVDAVPHRERGKPAQPEATAADAQAAIHYAEANGIDASTDEGWEKAMSAVLARKKK